MASHPSLVLTNPWSAVFNLTVRFRTQLSFPLLFLVAFLQRTPVLRVLLAEGGSLANLSSGHVLRSGLVAAAAVGSLDTLVGATTFSTTPTGSPEATFSVKVGDSVNVSFTVTGAPSAVKSFKVQGTLPPGTAISGLSNGVVNNATPSIAGTLTTAGTYVTQVMAYDKTGGTGKTDNVWYDITFIVAAAPATAPSITTQPSSATVTAGGSASFSVVASGTAPLSYQWYLGSAAISGATSATYSISSVTASQAGNYTVKVTNTAGTATSNAAVLTVNAAVTAPAFAIQPLGGTVVAGQLVSLLGGVTSASGTVSYQWYKDGVPLSGATSANLLISSMGAANAGSYVLKATGTGGTSSSNAAVLVLGNASGAPLSNMSIQTTTTAGDPFTLGFVISGGSSQTVLIRAGGPGLAAFGVTGTISDPILSVYDGSSVKLAENDNWDSGLTATFNRVGAYAFTTGSKDAAILLTLPPGGYTVQVKDVNSATGKALAEVYLVEIGK